MILEICANSLPSALAAQEGGAHRIELCTALELGGLTPSPGAIAKAREFLFIELMVLIRCREGDFCYSDMEMEAMLQDILYCKEAGCDGVVLGCLTPKGEVDSRRTRLLLEAARPMQVSFHRAFDLCADPFRALEQIAELGIERILTSGQQPSVWEGRHILAKLVKQSVQLAGVPDLTSRLSPPISIMAGGGLDPLKIKDLISQTGITEIHTSARSRRKSPYQTDSPLGTLNDLPDAPGQDFFETEVERVREILRVLED